jgi:4-hydroxybenzoyl-CoA thioesterase
VTHGPSILEFEVDWSDCDPAGIVFYPQFFRMMNTGTHKMFATVGLPFHELTAKYGTVGIPLLDVKSTFKSPAWHGDRITLHSSITEWRDKTFLVHHVMRAGDRVVFEADEVRVWARADAIAPNGIRAIPIPAEIKGLFGA